MIEEGNFGYVEVIAGKHKGKIGYYDDDELRYCIVYFDTPFKSAYFRLKPSSLVKTDTPHLPTERLFKDMPEFCSNVGIVR